MTCSRPLKAPARTVPFRSGCGQPGEILEGVCEIRNAVSSALIPLFTTDRIVAARCRGVGVLSPADALAYGVVGPVARASGLDMDLRRDNPYLVYRAFEFRVPTQNEGDVMARLVVRALKLLESCHIIEQALKQIPQGPLQAGEIYSVGPGEAVARIEGPRGEVFYFVASDGSDTPMRVKVRTPSFVNIPSVVAMVKGLSRVRPPHSFSQPIIGRASMARIAAGYMAWCHHGEAALP